MMSNFIYVKLYICHGSPTFDPVWATNKLLIKQWSVHGQGETCGLRFWTVVTVSRSGHLYNRHVIGCPIVCTFRFVNVTVICIGHLSTEIAPAEPGSVDRRTDRTIYQVIINMHFIL